MEENKQLTTISQEVANVTKGIATIKTEITDAIRDNDNSLKNCIAAGETLLAKVGTGMTDELDAEISTFIKRGKATVKGMGERRKTVTQVFDLVKKGFTSMEAMLDIKNESSVLFKLQKARDEYAQAKLEQQRKEEERRQMEARIESAKAQLASDTKRLCSDILTVYVTDQCSALNKLFDDITLANAQEKKQAISDFPATVKLAGFLRRSECATYDRTAIEVMVDRFLDNTPCEVPEDDIKAVKNAAFKECHAEYEARFTNTVSQLRQELLDRFDSKIEELNLQKKAEEEAERKRKAEAEAREKAEKAAAKEREEAEKEAERLKKEREEAEKEAERLKKEREEAEKEAADLQKQKIEADAQQRNQNLQIESAQGQAVSLFNEAAVQTPVKAKVSKHIEVDDPTAFLDVIQMWWAYEGSVMSVEELSKKLGFMIKACEKKANKDDVFIKNGHIRYIEDVVAK